MGSAAVALDSPSVCCPPDTVAAAAASWVCRRCACSRAEELACAAHPPPAGNRIADVSHLQPLTALSHLYSLVRRKNKNVCDHVGLQQSGAHASGPMPPTAGPGGQPAGGRLAVPLAVSRMDRAGASCCRQALEGGGARAGCARFPRHVGGRCRCSLLGAPSGARGFPAAPSIPARIPASPPASPQGRC